ncbi:MAG TPA: aminotransferase class I/II-fold pyridoxal phosphate-dependent enzyme [Pyrinomonadaceae bacterium]|nr:aminotransferase class I/II-fold pyridoxal phosphate-dependent enzyme [Pyrinomonadaceae bacterium]
MDDLTHDKIGARIQVWRERIAEAQENELYFYNQPIEELRGGARVLVNGREMQMFASYSYLGLIGHPRINDAAKAAIDKYGSGTHGVRMLAGTLKIHTELEEKIAQFKQTESAITFSSGYITNVTAISTLLRREDVVLSDKLNHASIVDGCMLSGAGVVRFRHNDMADLEFCLQRVNPEAARLVVVDAVFSMDGDVINLPRIVELCRKYGAWLMVDEAHSLGVLGEKGHGIEEHFGMDNVIDLKMGTLSKTIPSAGGYLAGSKDLIQMFRHSARPYVFSAALTPAQAGAAKAALEVIEDEPERIATLRENTRQFLQGFKQLGFDTMQTTTAIVPLLCGADESAYRMVQSCHRNDVFVLPIVSPAVPDGLARLRATVTAAHTRADIDKGLSVFERAGRETGII